MGKRPTGSGGEPSSPNRQASAGVEARLIHRLRQLFSECCPQVPESPFTLASSNRSTLLTLTAPVAMGYIPLGAVFGFLFVQAGGHWGLALLLSLFVYAGAAQYMVIPMLVAQLPIATIALATLVVNLRHVFYGLSLLQRLPPHVGLRSYMAFTLTDETYSILTTLPPQTPVQHLLGLAVLNHGWWLLGTALGTLIGSQAQLQWVGLDFVLASLFAVLLVEQWRNRRQSLPIWVALFAYAVAYATLPTHALLLSIALSLGMGFWLSATTNHA